MKLQRTENAKNGIVFGVISNLFTVIVPFFMRTIMNYTLGVEYLGLNSLFSSILQVLNLAELGVGSAMVFSMYAPIADEDTEKICMLMGLYKKYYRIIGAVVLCVGLVLVPFLPDLIASDIPNDINIYVLYLMNLLATVLSYWLFAYKNSLLDAFQRRDIMSKIALGVNAGRYGLQILALILIKDYHVYVLIHLATQVVNNLVTAFVVNKKYPQYQARSGLPKNEIHAINLKVKDLVYQKIGGVVNSSSDTLIISAFLGLTSLAMYQNYYYVLSLPLALCNVALGSALAGIGNSLLTESAEKNLRDLRRMTFLCMGATAICCCGLICMYQDFMIMWMGEDLTFSIEIVALFVVYFYASVLGRVLDTFKDAAGIWHQDRFRPICAAMTNLIVNIILVQFIGMYGILISTIISLLLVSFPWELSILFHTAFHNGAKKYLLLLLKNAILTVAMCMIAYLICIFLPVGNFVWFIVKGVIAMITALIILVSFNLKTEEFSYSVQLFSGILKGTAKK